ncbi:hypothetical protein ACFP3U_32405 [Kitasatospora misakiensis]|uniref:Uncharacterized protein n=1 Tax=Kitasatospora misakiensis TaxID=67330 RepID=A0ABW0XAU1_9ACTN
MAPDTAAGGTTVGTPAGTGTGTGASTGADSSSVGPARPGESGRPTPKGNAASVAQGSDDAPFDWDDDWGTDEVMLLLLAIMLPVLVVLAAALSVRQRRKAGPGGGD